MSATHDDIEIPMTYGTYLKVNELLELQELQSDPPMHDELLFISIHQAYEIWFKQILFELDTAKKRLELDDIFEAHRLIKRVIKIECLLVDQIHILETMTPRDFASFRSRSSTSDFFCCAFRVASSCAVSPANVECRRDPEP